VTTANRREYATAVTHDLSAMRAATTEPQERLIEHAALVLRDDERVLAAWLVGSFARGNADPWSDIDLHCTIADDSTEELRTHWPDLARRITPTVQTKAFFPGSLGGYCITPEWLHVDLALHPRGTLDPNTVVPMRPLFDKTGVLLPTQAVPGPAVAREPYFPVDAVDWFFYMFGNLVTVVGRDEPVWAMNGVITLRDTGLVPLFFAERGIARVGGNKRLNPFLSTEQQELLRNLPPLAPTIDSVIEAEAAIARIFIPRGRRLAAATGAAWPSELERATVAYFEHNLDTKVFAST
jgi:hypothetical protein